MAKWEQAYSCYTLEVGKNLYISIVWEKPGFRVSFSGRTLDKIFTDVVTAKIAGLQLANKVLTAAINEVITAQKDIQ